MQISSYPPLTIKEFIEGMCKIDGNKITIYSYQESFFNSKSKFRIVNKARQIGFSTAIAMEALYKAIWYPNKTILFVSTGDRTSRLLMRGIEQLLNSMDVFEIVTEDGSGTKRLATNKLRVDTTREKVFKNNSRIISLPNNPDNVRGYQATDVYIDEHAFFENPEEIWTAILPALTRGERITINSTPRGKLGQYWKIWDESIGGLNEFERFEFPYSKIRSELSPQIVENIEEIRANMSELQFLQEYECQFIDENISMFPYEIIKPCIDENVPFAFKHQTANPIYMGIDFGIQRNSTIIVFFEKTKDGWVLMQPIKEFMGAKRLDVSDPEHKHEADFTPILEWIKKSIMVVRPTRVYLDANGMGERLFDELRRDFGALLYPVKANNEMKEKLILTLRILFENQRIKIPDSDLVISQLHDLQKSATPSGKAKYKHSPGKYDDVVWAMCYALMAEAQSGIRPAISSVQSLAH